MIEVSNEMEVKFLVMKIWIEKNREDTIQLADNMTGSRLKKIKIQLKKNCRDWDAYYLWISDHWWEN